MKPNNSYVTNVFSGAVSGDIWSCVTNCISAENTTFGPGADFNTYAAAALAAFNSTIWNSASGIKQANSAATTLTSCKTYVYNSGGVLVQEGSATQTAVPGTGTTRLPPYSALCVTLKTNGFGRSYRGRSYIPFTAGTLGADGQASSGQCSSLATNYIAFINAMVAIAVPGAAGDELQPAVLSVAKGLLSNISSVKVDSLVDTQRGRQNRATASSTATASL